MLLSSCGYDEEEECYHAPLDCTYEAPESGVVTACLSPTSDRSPITVTFYAGSVEQGHVLRVAEIAEASRDFVFANGEISARARYRTEIDGEIAVVNAVDGGVLEFDEEHYCEGYCYEPGTLSLDLTLAKGLTPLGQP
jgi:hypothetical protein